jgi:hypothetical protein
MTVEASLFLLRLISGAALLSVLGLLLLVMWRDYRGAAQQAAAARRAYGRLVVLEEADDGLLPTEKFYPLLPITSLGRSPTNTIMVDDDFASGEHALVAMRNGQWWLEDRQSRNGTTINGVPINQPVIVTDGDIIGVGHYQFRLELEV